MYVIEMVNNLMWRIILIEYTLIILDNGVKGIIFEIIKEWVNKGL